MDTLAQGKDAKRARRELGESLARLLPSLLELVRADQGCTDAERQCAMWLAASAQMAPSA